jgi:predicted kinase
MTQDEIIEMAKQAGYDEHNAKFDTRIQSLAKLVAQHEREACVKVCETLWNTPTNGMATEEESYGEQCAEAIRARGQA